MLQIIARAKYLEPPLTEGDMINNLAHHFGRIIQAAVITQGVKTVEFMVLLTKWENINSTNDPEVNKK